MMQENTYGDFIIKENPPHLAVSEDIALRLYGFNKWANENKIDAIIHIHFNDYPRPTKWTIGKYKGFVIYIPDGQFANSKESTATCNKYFYTVALNLVTSTWKPEINRVEPQ